MVGNCWKIWNVAAAGHGLGTNMHSDTIIRSTYDVLLLEGILDPDDVNVNVNLNRLQTADHAAKTSKSRLISHQTALYSMDKFYQQSEF